ncbi:hypothetical protein NP233_g3216 [Leucocoprinus birnbaumii]|uniref:Uncharacterized protein n=1 Tax=Leucocoprinus birnbaumii TaxID=56174 RepID=A0AAD5W0Q8_9AGAR|nr:hypothetical protein NP233_g3216 [Leucocoprinus birnbaumii]
MSSEYPARDCIKSSYNPHQWFLPFWSVRSLRSTTIKTCALLHVDRSVRRTISASCILRTHLAGPELSSFRLASSQRFQFQNLTNPGMLLSAVQDLTIHQCINVSTLHFNLEEQCDMASLMSHLGFNRWLLNQLSLRTLPSPEDTQASELFGYFAHARSLVALPASQHPTSPVFSRLTNSDNFIHTINARDVDRVSDTCGAMDVVCARLRWNGRRRRIVEHEISVNHGKCDLHRRRVGLDEQYPSDVTLPDSSLLGRTLLGAFGPLCSYVSMSISWSYWKENCDAENLSSTTLPYPEDLTTADNVAFPNFASVNPVKWTYGRFDATQAKDYQLRNPGDWKDPRPFREAQARRRRKIGAITGGAIGGFIIIVMILCTVLYRRMRRKEEERRHTRDISSFTLLSTSSPSLHLTSWSYSSKGSLPSANVSTPFPPMHPSTFPIPMPTSPPPYSKTSSPVSIISYLRRNTEEAP